VIALVRPRIGKEQSTLGVIEGAVDLPLSDVSLVQVCPNNVGAFEVCLVEVGATEECLPYVQCADSSAPVLAHRFGVPDRCTTLVLLPWVREGALLNGVE
jgi:hypothetical protein